MLSVLYNNLKALYATENLQGYTDKDILILKEIFGTLPQVLEDYYRIAGHTKEFHCVQDNWLRPEDFQKRKWLRESEYLILLNENQGVCRAGIHKDDLSLPDPPVYSTEDDKNWVLCASSTSEFLSAALAYEAVFSFEYCPEEFYWLSDVDVDLINSKLTKLPFELKNWIGETTISLYSNKIDNMAAIIDCQDNSPSMLYGAATQASYMKLLSVLDGIGEPM